MKLFCFDTETHLIKPGAAIPRMVSFAYLVDDGIRGLLVEDPVLLLAYDARGPFTEALRDPDVVFVGHNVAFDMAVCAHSWPDLIPLIFGAYRDGRVRCTQVREALHLIETGEIGFKRVNMKDTAKRRLGKDMSAVKKADAWRTRYSELDGVPVEQWPAEAREYALDDARVTHSIFLSQGGLDHQWGSEQLQTEAAWALFLMGAWGVRTRGDRVAQLKATLQSEIEQIRAPLLAAGLLRPTGSRNMAEIRDRVSSWFNDTAGMVPLTETGKVSTAKDVLLSTHDPLLGKLAEMGAVEKVLSTYVPALQQGVTVPINPWFNVLVASGRTSCRNPNLQNIPRVGNVRECFIPRPGYVYVACDYDVLEMCALAQVLLDWFGFSRMAEAINAGQDLHTSFAADLMGISYDEALKLREARDKNFDEKRRFAKVANFGFPGGLGAATMVDYAKGYGVFITEQEAKTLKQEWMAFEPAMKLYFDRIGQMAVADEFTIEQHVTGRRRGGCFYTSGCNTMFQGLAADGAKDALTHVTRECYTAPDSPLFGSRPVLFIHDEIIIEAPEEKVHEAAQRLEEVMVRRMEKYISRVRISAGAVAMRWWSKDAYEVRDADGRLVPWNG